MSIIARTASTVKPTPTRKTVVLFDATVTHAAPRTFGRGLLRSLPSYHSPFTSEDAAWWAEESAQAEDRHYDRLAAAAAMQTRLDRGHCI